MSRKKMVDAIDIQILNILQGEGRITSKELANRIDLSEPATHHRLQNLIRHKIIQSIHACLDFARLGLNFKALLHIKVATPKRHWLLGKLKESRRAMMIVEVRNDEYQLANVTRIYAMMIFRSQQRFSEFAQDLFLSDDDTLVYFEYFEITETISEVSAVALQAEEIN